MQLVAGVAGALILGPAGFALATAGTGFAIGSVLFGIFGPRPKGPGPGDLSGPAIQLGSQLPRVYGRVRLAVSPISISAYRATAQESGGKGSSSQVTGYTYDIDVYGIVADTPVIPVIAVVREWHNKELIFTALADSSAESLTASAALDRYASVVDLFGDAGQSPAPLYEDRVGTVNAPANILMHTREYAGLQCGSSKTLPQIEVEVITQGTPATGLANCVLQANFVSDASDSSYYNNTPTVSGSWTYGGTLATGIANAAKTVSWGDADMAVRSETGFTLQAIVTLRDPNMDFGNAGDANNILLRMDWTSGSAWALSLSAYRDFSGDLYLISSDGASEYFRTIVAADTNYHVAWVVSAGASPTLTIYLDGVVFYTGAYADRPSASASVRTQMYASFGTRGWELAWIDLWMTPLYSGTFSPPTEPGAPDSPNNTWTPLPETLDNVITAELSLYPDFDPASIDVTGVAAIEVTGFTAVGDPARNVAELCDMFYVGVVPGYPIKFVQLGAAVIGTIPFADTGAGAGQPGESFHGLDQGDNDEISGVKAIRYPSIDRDHNPDFRRGDRLTTDGPDVQATETRVVFTDVEAKGRAITATLMARDAKDTAEFPISDRYAAAEPIDCYTVTDREGNSYRMRIDSLTYADGVRSCRWTKDEPASLVQSGLTDLSNTPGIEVAPPVVITLYVLDIPLLRDADNSYGLYVCCTAIGNWQGARVYRSADDITYTEVAAIANKATVGAASGALANYTGWTWDNSSTLTVTLDAGSGGVLTSATKTAIEASETLNSAAIGVHGRWELVRFSTATLVTGTTYLLSGFLRGQKGTEWANSTHQAGDRFVLLQESGMARIAGSASDIGVVRYYKAVPNGRSIGGYTGAAFTTAEQGLMPYAPVDLWNDAGTLRWNRRSRLSAAVGLDPPLGEDSESYAVELDGVETDTVSTNEWTPVAPVSGETLLVAQRSAQIGAGHEASKAIT